MPDSYTLTGTDDSTAAWSTSCTNLTWSSWTSTILTTSATTDTYSSSGGTGGLVNTSFTFYTSENKLLKLKNALKLKRKQRPIVRRASELLRLVLTEKEWQEWRRYRSVQVVGSLGGKYEVGPGWSGRVVELDENYQPVRLICYHVTTESLPLEDEIAAIVLDIKCDESRLLQCRSGHAKSFRDEKEARKFKSRRIHRKQYEQLCA